ncbi:hypothetical protein RND71_001614 [Anisodus tanguticus]|uniref:Uncharacterized protein n=1 Tax=Anisodus tanguticus TaxID=243964 RepID=A0AAE1T180_9SOLA|nr:hypothetical protein RND71_001614 [Anisodus tanguticus]
MEELEHRRFLFCLKRRASELGSGRVEFAENGQHGQIRDSHFKDKKGEDLGELGFEAKPYTSVAAYTGPGPGYWAMVGSVEGVTSHYYPNGLIQSTNGYVEEKVDELCQIFGKEYGDPLRIVGVGAGA